MKKFGLFILIASFVCCDVMFITSNAFGESEQIKASVSKLDSFDKKKYDVLVKSILRYKYPSFINRSVKTGFKEIAYLGVSGAIGFGAFNGMEQTNNSNNSAATALLCAAFAHTLMRLVFNYLLISKDENLKNLENFEKYINQVLSSKDALLSTEADLVLKLFEKDYDLILSKVDQEYGAGWIRRFIKWIFNHNVFLLESATIGVGTFLLVNNEFMGNICAGVGAGIVYYLMLIVLCDFMLASKDQRMLKIEKLREISSFIEEIKLEKVALQHEIIAETEKNSSPIF